MAFGIGSTLGGGFVGSIVSEEVYDPVYDTSMDVVFLWQLLPSFYRNLMEDQDLLEVVWSGVVQAAASDLLNLWTTDYAKSLTTVPVLSQRKWIEFDLTVPVDLSSDPGLTIDAVPGLFSYDVDLAAISCRWINRNRRDKATLPLRGQATEETSLSWSFEVNMSSMGYRAVALVGYYSSQDDPLKDALTAGLIGSQTAPEDRPSLVIMHFSPEGVVTKSEGAYVLSMDTDYRIDCTYTARTGIVVAKLTELRAQKAVGTAGETGDDFSSVFTNVFTDSTVNFESIAAAGDYLVAYGEEYEIISVDGSSLTVRTLSLPVDTANVSYEILGEVEQTSISLNLPGEAGNPRFTVDQFGTSSLDIRSTTLAAFPSPALLARRTAVGITKGWAYFDPTVGDVILSLPRLQEVITSPTMLLYEGTDFVVETRELLNFNGVVVTSGALATGLPIVGVVSGAKGVIQTIAESAIEVSPRGGAFFPNETLSVGAGAAEATATQITSRSIGTTIKFQEPQLEPLWAEYVGYDEGYIANNFGVNVGLVEKSSDQYKAKVRGLYFAFFQGPTLTAVRTGVHILMGLPIAEVAGTVESVNPAYSGTVGIITVAGIDYQYPLIVGTDLGVGDEVELFEPLSRGVEVVDYITDPEWFVNFNFNELRKYHTFQVRLDLDAFDVLTLAAAGEFVEAIKPTWKDSQFLVFKNLLDDVEMVDDILIAITLSLYDEPCDPPGPLIAWDMQSYEGEADWRFDQGILDWDETSATMREHSTPISGYGSFTNGSVIVIGTSSAFVTDIGLGAHSTRFLLLALRLAGSAGETTSSQNEFIDNTVDFTTNGLEAGDEIVIAGEGTFFVLSIDSANQITLDGPMANTAVGVLWVSRGKKKLWGSVDVVATQTAMTMQTPFPGVDGNYFLDLLDNDYKNAWYDQFQEACPDEQFELRITYTAGAPPRTIDVPVADPAAPPAPYTFTSTGETYSVILDERTP